MSVLSEDLYSEVDTVDKESWYKIINNFRDANLYQTWAYDEVRFGTKKMSHLLLKYKNEIIGAVQVRVIKIPGIKAGIAYIRMGPLWRRYDSAARLEDLGQILRAIYIEYVQKRGLYLRVIPNIIEDFNKDIQSIFERVGLKWINKNNRTLYLNLDPSLEFLHKNLKRTWRQNLNKAEKRDLEILEGTSIELFDNVMNLFAETVSRKGFIPGINIEEFRAMQMKLPESFKMQIMICKHGDHPIAGLINSAIGEIGIDLIAATGNDGMRFGGNHLLRWRMLDHLKDKGCKFYDLGGIDPDKNPGGYQFKTGLSGNNGYDVYFIGNFEACQNRLNMIVIKSSESFIENFGKLKVLFNKWFRILIPHHKDNRS